MTDNSADNSPFHPGEQQLQTRMGVRDKMERFGGRVIRAHMPVQHQQFYQQLPFILLGHADKAGWPWASILTSSITANNDPGFITSPDNKTLNIAATPISGDPLGNALSVGTRLGLLGIELHTKRRNRLAAHIVGVDHQHIQLAVDQAFGNCPKYIQHRELVKVDSGPSSKVDALDHFDSRARQLIENSDTFFVASSYDEGDEGKVVEGKEAPWAGADVSHRGGEPGFVAIDNDKTLTIPDYSGNFHFNTLGNFVNNPKAGLLFIDFNQGHLLSVTGTVEIIWDADEALRFAGAQRLWRFHIDHGYWISHGCTLRC